MATVPQAIKFSAASVARVHTVLAAAAFGTALFIGSILHFKKIVKNGVAGYPDEWFPSVSATIGDWYPERNIFQILIALTSGPRFALVFMQYYIQRSESILPTIVFVFGLIRTLSCGGWVYITSTDDHDVHDVMMITYMVCNIPWMLGGVSSTPTKLSDVRRKRKSIAILFFSSLIPLIYYFVQHKVYRIPGAYTRYSFFEWGLIIFDITYDSVTEQEFRESNLHMSLGSSTMTVSTSEQILQTSTENKENNGTSEKALSGTEALSSASQNEAGAANKDISSSSMKSHTLLPTLHFLSDVYLSYLFWSLLTSLIPTLFYFSVWELGLAGHESALFTTLSPMFLFISPLRRWLRTNAGQATFHTLSLVGLAAYLSENPLHRLFMVAFANVITVMRQAAQWTGVHGADIGYQAFVTGLGLIVSSLSKHANHGNNPVWPFITASSGGYNKTGLFLACISIYSLYTRPLPPPTIKGSKATRQHLPSSDISTSCAALPLGSLLFCLHHHLADASTLIAWSWTGYENGLPKGPLPHVHGTLTHIAQSLGLLISVMSTTSHPDISTSSFFGHPLWLLYGGVTAYIMYGFRNWAGYIGSLNHSIFLMSIIPLVLQRAAATGKVTRTYTLAFFVYCLLNLASIFTVAYAFVPGGQYFRERTDLVVLVQMACIALAFTGSANNMRPQLYLPVEAASRVTAVLASTVVLSILVSMYHTPGSTVQPYKSGPRVINAGIWTVHFGIDNEGHDSQRGMRNLIGDMKLDIVGLLETDLHRTSFGHRDLTRIIVEDQVFNVDIGPGPNSHTWGCVLLSKFPIINSTHHLLPSPHGELAPAIEAVLDIYGTPVTVVVAHNGQEEDPLDRELQAKELARIMSAAYPRPVIFLGYVVTVPHAKRPNPYEIMVEDGRVHDIDAEDMDRWCEYIFYRGLYRTSYARISRGIITDTEMQIGQFVLPKHGYNVTNESQQARYLRARKEELSEDHWFPMEYYGNKDSGGVDGHFYHVFNTPLYYKVPDDAIL